MPVVGASRRIASPPLAALAALMMLAGAGCSEDQSEPKRPASTRTLDVVVPDGVQLTEPGSTVRVGESAVVSYVVGPQRRAVVEVRVTRIRRGVARDFVGYQLDRATASATPWYVEAEMTVLGGGRLGRAPLPVYGFDSTNTFFPAAEVEGSFDRCPPPDEARSLGRGDLVRGCLVFFVPRRATFEAVQLRATEGVEPISWSIPPWAGGDTGD